MLTAILVGLSIGCASNPKSPAAIAELGVSLQEAPAESKRVLVVINKKSDESRLIGEYYIYRRKIPQSNVLLLDLPVTDNIEWNPYLDLLESRVKKKIEGLSHRIDFIVLCKGVPIRLRSDGGYSVDGHLAAMNLAFEPIAKPEPEQIKRCLNPYFNKAEPFTSAKYGFYLVTRLDGYTVDHVKRLIDQSVNGRPNQGPFLLDQDPTKTEGGYKMMHDSLVRAAKVLQQKGFEVNSDETPVFVGSSWPVAGYASWGSNDKKFNADVYRGLRFLPGAIAETFVSTSARTFQVVSSGQSVISDLVAGGVTGVKGYVSEPYTFALAYPDILFDRYTGGFNLAESFYMASMVLKWKDIVVGDPLCSPYSKKSSGASSLGEGEPKEREPLGAR